MIAPTDLVGYSTFIPDRALTRTGYEKNRPWSVLYGYLYLELFASTARAHACS